MVFLQSIRLTCKPNQNIWQGECMRQHYTNYQLWLISQQLKIGSPSNENSCKLAVEYRKIIKSNSDDQNQILT